MSISRYADRAPRPPRRRPEPAPAPVNYLNDAHGIWSWLFTVDHKRIGILYLVSITRVLHGRRARGRAGPAEPALARTARS